MAIKMEYSFPRVILAGISFRLLVHFIPVCAPSSLCEHLLFTLEPSLVDRGLSCLESRTSYPRLITPASSLRSSRSSPSTHLSAVIQTWQNALRPPMAEKLTFARDSHALRCHSPLSSCSSTYLQLPQLKKPRGEA